MSNQREDSKKHSNTKDTSINQSYLHLIQIHDSAFPSGNFAHSFGMETYIQEDDIRNEADLKVFCEMYLRHNFASGDAIIAKEAYRLAKKRDLDGLIKLENICHAVKLSPETREGSMMMGRQFSRTIQPLIDDEFMLLWLEKFKNKEVKNHYSVVYGIYTALIDVSPKMSLETFLYSSITALVLNAVRAVPVGQMSGVKTVHAMLPIIEEIAEDVMDYDLDDLDNNSIALEISSMRHEFLNSRLFIS